MALAKVFGGIALVYATGLTLFANYVAGSLMQNDIGAITLKSGDNYATLPIPAGACTTVDAMSTCRLSIESQPLILRYRLASPIRTNLLTVGPILCNVEFEVESVNCSISWSNPPDRKEAFATLTGPAGDHALQAIQREWPMLHLPESTWMNLALWNAIPIGLSLWFTWRGKVRGVVPGLFVAGLVALATWYVTGFFGLLVLRRFVD